jgi:hypothetical protein
LRQVLSFAPADACTLQMRLVLNLSLENQALGFKAKESFRSLLSQVHRFINSYSPLTSFEWTVTLVT